MAIPERGLAPKDRQHHTGAVHLNGEYGIKDNFVVVPVKLGKNRIEEIVQIKLTAEEQAALNKSAEEVKSQIAKLKL